MPTWDRCCSRAIGTGVSLALAAIVGLLSPTVLAAQDVPLDAPSSRAELETLEPLLTGPLPRDLQPPLSVARGDRPSSSDDDCHLDLETVEIADCAYGAPDSEEAVILIGNSHAAQWFTALEAVATERDWRLVQLTKSACPAAQITVWNSWLDRLYHECDEWRRIALDRIAEERPLITFVASSGGYTWPSGDVTLHYSRAPDEWRSGLEEMLSQVGRRSEHVVLLADTPRLRFDPIECLTEQASVGDCPAPRDQTVRSTYTELEAQAARASGAVLVDANPWICPGELCPLVRGNVLVFRDTNHFTATFMRLLADPLAQALDEAMERQPGLGLRGTSQETGDASG